MPFVKLRDADLYYEESGSGDETIVFSHGLLFDHRMWEYQLACFSGRYRCIAYDHRGQGRSTVTVLNVLPGAGPCSCLEVPGELNRLIGDFLANASKN
jgi:pimeloyl-ACP methyl ester carboxylesterase